MERLHDACGIVGIYTRKHDQSIDVHRFLVHALIALQHRGEDSTGMAVYDNGGKIVSHVCIGKVREVFSESGTGLPGTRCGIGHVRYSTTGSSCVENAGPFVVGAWRGHYNTIAIAHNGNLINGPALREQLPEEYLQSTTDSEAIALLLLHAEGPTLRERMITILLLLRGAYSLVILAESKLYAMRDPWGMRSLPDTFVCKREMKEKRPYVGEGGEEKNMRSSVQTEKYNLFGGRPQWIPLVYFGRTGMSN